MRLPHAERAKVDRAKIVDYLLCSSHPDGASKATFFSSFGFRATEWEAFAAALRRHGQTHAVTKSVESAFGARYSVDGDMETPDGRHPCVRTVWIVEAGEEAPRLITAHPVKGNE